WAGTRSKRKARPPLRERKTLGAQPHQLGRARRGVRRQRRMVRAQGEALRCPHHVSGQIRRRCSRPTDRPEARTQSGRGRPQRRHAADLTTQPPGANARWSFIAMEQKPQTYNGDLGKLPPALAHLRDERIWLCWRWVLNEKKTKWTKPPRRADNPDFNASSSDPNSWGSYDQALEQVRTGNADGIGFAIKGRNIGGIDLDHCRDPETEEIDAWAVEYLCQFPGAYTEITVSGKGLRILGTSTLESFAPKFKKNGIDVELFSNSN